MGEAQGNLEPPDLNRTEPNGWAVRTERRLQRDQAVRHRSDGTERMERSDRPNVPTRSSRPTQIVRYRSDRGMDQAGGSNGHEGSSNEVQMDKRRSEGHGEVQMNAEDVQMNTIIFK